MYDSKLSAVRGVSQSVTNGLKPAVVGAAKTEGKSAVAAGPIPVVSAAGLPSNNVRVVSGVTG